MDSALDMSYLGTSFTMKSLFKLDRELVTLTSLTKCLTVLTLVISGALALPPQGSVRKAMRACVSPWGLHLLLHSKSSQDPWSSSWEVVTTPLCSRIVSQDAPMWAVTLPQVCLLLQRPAGDLTMRSSFSVTSTEKSQETNSYLFVTQISPGSPRVCHREWGLPPQSIYWVHPMGGPTDSIIPRTRLRWGASLLSFHRERDYGSQKPNHLHKVKQLKSGGIRIWSKESPRDRNF